MQKRAVILLSGGLDSATCLAIANSEGFECHALNVDYGQRHRIELAAAQTIAEHFQAKTFKRIQLSLRQLGGSALTDDQMEVPNYQGDGKIPATYVPARNTIFLSIALGFAEVLSATDIFIGASAVDYSGYPDCRPEYFKAFEQLATLATKAGVEGVSFRIRTPLLRLSKAETIALGLKLGVDHGMTVSCYRATENQKACGTCDSCILRLNAFKSLGIEDPLTSAR